MIAPNVELGASAVPKTINTKVQYQTCIIDFRTELFGCKANACIELIVFGCTGKTPLYYFSLDRSHNIFCSVNCFGRRYQNNVCYCIARVKVMTSCTLYKIPQMNILRDDYSMTEVMIFNACLTADYLRRLFVKLFSVSHDHRAENRLS